MMFSVNRDNRLPKLAWYCKIEPDFTAIDVTVGPHVDASDTWFFEGAWAGPFEAQDFLNMPCFGSGAKIEDGGILFTPPDHILDRLYVYKDKALHVSNSLPFLLARVGKTLKTDIYTYPYRFEDMRFGLSHHKGDWPLEGGDHVTSWCWHQMRVHPDLHFTAVEKERQVALDDFKTYRSYLGDTVRLVLENAAHPNRRVQFAPVTTISSGYDSTAVSVLAVEHGCKEAITFSKSRARWGRPAEDDSGLTAGNCLGLDTVELDRLDYLKSAEMPEIESFGAASELSSCIPMLQDRVLFTGVMGDSMWDRVPLADLTDLTWPRLASHNLTEMRLASGFVHLCLPFLACRQHKEIIKISQSEEMVPWSIGGDYDRPICRRICETAGIPREVFGQKKRATGVFFREEGLAETMTPHSYADYAAYRAEVTGVPGAVARRSDRMARVVRFLNSGVARLVRIFNRRARMTIRPPRFVLQNPRNAESAVLFQWAVTRLMERYQV